MICHATLPAARLAILVSAPLDMEAGEFSAPAGTAWGADLQIVFGAPGDEVVRVDMRPHHRHPSALSCALRVLGELLPLVESDGQLVTVSHDFSNTGIVCALVPSDTDGADLLRKHDGATPVDAVVCTVVGPREVASLSPEGLAA